MNPDEIVIIGVKDNVAAISRREGRIEWTTALPGGLGPTFVTIVCDDERVYAHTNGKLHCLDMRNGKLLWSNPLTGYGYGLATICVPGFGSSPDPAAIEAHVLAERQRNSSD